MTDPYRLAAAKKESASRTASSLLSSPKAEKLMGKEKLHALDFGYGDGIMTLGIAEAIARRLRPRELSMVAVNSERSNGGSNMIEFQLEETEVTLVFAEPYTAYFPGDLSKVMIMTGTGSFDVISLFNPSPTDRLMRPVLESNKAIMAREFGIDVTSALAMVGLSGKARSEEDYALEIRRVLESDCGVSLNETIGLDLSGLKHLAKLVALRRTIEVFPMVLSHGGLLIMATDGLVPPADTLGILARAGFEIVIDRNNERENIWNPSGLCDYNKYLFAAIKKE
jgi:hypothetical protein